MARIFRLIALLTVFALLSSTGADAKQLLQVTPEKSDDKTLSPYFFVKSDDPTVDQLPLKATSADVNIAGVIADVKVTQVYKNEGRKALEAIYIFPASTRAAVYGMKMTIGKRVIVAKINKREEARKQYEKAKQEGKSASLLEQQRPNVFQMNVANIMPGDTIKVELSYTELLVPEDRVYEFVYPTVVGPRYSNQPAATAAKDEKWVENPYTHQGGAPSYTFDITVNIAAGMPVRDISCASHKINAAFDGPVTASIKLDSSEKSGGNRDYILKYRLDGDKIESGLLLYKGAKENFFLLMMQPPKRVTAAEIPGREYIFIVDVSGSMYGFPLELSKKLLRDLIGNLRPTDIFNLILFSGGSTVMSDRSIPATKENIEKALFVIDKQKGGGGTELLPALKRSLDLPRTAGFSRSVVIATDGYVTVEPEVFDLIRKNLGNANMFTFGIGSSVNRHLLEGMARVGMGEPFVIAKESEAAEKAEKFRKIIESPVLTGIKTDFGGFDVYDVEPISVPDVMADRPVIVFGKWRGKPKGVITISGTAGSGEYKATVNVADAKPTELNAALKYLWARHKIGILSDYNLLRKDDKRVEEVTQLGLKYNLLTAYTSFVAIDSEVRNKDGKSETVKQPLPMPQGVSDYAVGYAPAYAAPSPSTRYYKAMAGPRGGVAPVEAADVALVNKEPEKAAAVKTSVVKVEAQAAADSAAIKGVFEQKIGELAGCNKAGFRGRVRVVLTIAADGTVKVVSIAKGSLADEKLKNCLEGLIAKLQFSAPQSAADISATITLDFK